MKITRRRFLKQLGGVGAAGVLTAGYGRFVEPFWVELVKRPLSLPNLPAHLHGKTVMQISDIHAGDNISRDYLVRELQQAAALQPDIVVYTGDFVSYESAAQYDQLNSVIKHAPLGKLGTFGVLGNHDYGPAWQDAQVGANVVDTVSKVGITILQNDVVQLDGLQIGGIDDFWGPNFAPQQTISQLRDNAAAIVLCHNPDVCDLPRVWEGVQGWVLSGHTHGGQVRPPFFKAPVVPVRNKSYTAGAYRLANGRNLYINRALGHYIPLRFNVRPEITLFTLA